MLPVARGATIALATVTAFLVAVAICNAVLAARPFDLDPFSDAATQVADLCSFVLFAAVVAAAALASYAPTSGGALTIAASRVFPWMGVAAVAATGARLNGFDPYYAPSLQRFSEGAWGAEPLLLCAAGLVVIAFLIPRGRAEARAGVMIVAMFLDLGAVFLTGSGH
jgi:hypothetical protein